MSKIPNNPQKAYMLGKHRGTQECLSMVAMILMDRLGWEVRGDGEQNIKWLVDTLEFYTDEINNGHIKFRDIKGVLLEEYGLEFT